MKQKEDPMYRLVRANPDYFKDLLTKNRKYNATSSEDKLVIKKQN